MPHPCERVMVVDDDEDTREATVMLLESEGIEALAAEPLEALEILRDGYRPDAIVLDLVMPDVSGRTFRARLKLDPELRTIPIVLCTASPQLAVVGDYDALIAKPFDPEAFFDALSKICMETPALE
jgi:twitching motility two-component system response regulator PilH